MPACVKKSTFRTGTSLIDYFMSQEYQRAECMVAKPVGQRPPTMRNLSDIHRRVSLSDPLIRRSIGQVDVYVT